MADPHCSKTAAARIELIREAKETQRRQIFELLAPLGLDAPRSSPALDRSGLLHGGCRGSKASLSYYDNVFRDWAWENGENERLLDCIARVLQAAPDYRPARCSRSAQAPPLVVRLPSALSSPSCRSRST